MSARVMQSDSRAADAGIDQWSLSNDAFVFLSRFVYEHCGIVLGDHKRQLVQGRLSRRLRALGLDSFDGYVELLRDSPDNELGELVSAISTNVTSFFREMHHYDLLSNELLPQWLEQKRRQGDRLRIWSAGCSTGEEPYALAMVLAEALERSGGKIDARILATDLSPQALSVARAGKYPMERMGGITEARRQRWFTRNEGDQHGVYTVHPRLRELVTIQPLNLMHEWPMRGPFDAIFCRNVVIYFDRETKQRLFERYASLLQPGGYLFLGHSESMYGFTAPFELIGRTVYRKTSP